MESILTPIRDSCRHAGPLRLFAGPMTRCQVILNVLLHPPHCSDMQWILPGLPSTSHLMITSQRYKEVLKFSELSSRLALLCINLSVSLTKLAVVPQTGSTSKSIASAYIITRIKRVVYPRHAYSRSFLLRLPPLARDPTPAAAAAPSSTTPHFADVHISSPTSLIEERAIDRRIIRSRKSLGRPFQMD